MLESVDEPIALPVIREPLGAEMLHLPAQPCLPRRRQGGGWRSWLPHIQWRLRRALQGRIGAALPGGGGKDLGGDGLHPVASQELPHHGGHCRTADPEDELHSAPPFPRTARCNRAGETARRSRPSATSAVGGIKSHGHWRGRCK